MIPYIVAQYKYLLKIYLDKDFTWGQDIFMCAGWFYGNFYIELQYMKPYIEFQYKIFLIINLHKTKIYWTCLKSMPLLTLRKVSFWASKYGVM